MRTIGSGVLGFGLSMAVIESPFTGVVGQWIRLAGVLVAVFGINMLVNGAVGGNRD